MYARDPGFDSLASAAGWLLRAARFPFRRWNWKSAIMSVMIRSLAFFLVAAKHGHHSGLRAALIEAAYVSLTAGFYSAAQQGALKIERRWLSNLVIVVAVPVFAQCVDYTVQSLAGTPNLKMVSLGMVCFGLLSASFHLHMMRNGAMIVGNQAHSFSSDLKRVPWLIGTFVATPVMATLAYFRSRSMEPAVAVASIDSELAA